jgi:hypothetical protein
VFCTIGKQRYTEKVKETIIGFCHENGEPEPNWAYCSIPPVTLSDDMQTEQDVQAFYSKLLPYLLNMLCELRTGYYLSKQLEESHQQTLEAHQQTRESEKQTEEAIKANKKTTIALWFSGIAIIVSILAFAFSTCTRTIKFDESQFHEIKAGTGCDSINIFLQKSNNE